MRNLENRKFFIPSMTEEDIVSLGLKPKGISPTTVVDLAGQTGAYVTYPDPQIFTLRIRPLDKTQSDCRADYGCRIYYGILLYML
jgi:hypothetical protein